jgi:hypothetical protein
MTIKEKLIKTGQWAAIVITATLLLGTFTLLFSESRWVKAESMSPADSFRYASTGTELMPLPVFKVLPILFPDQFQPGGKQAGDWIDQYGFIRGNPSANEGLPQGFFTSNHRPKSGAPSPVKFVGINCSLCHSSRIKQSDDDPGVVVMGMGSTALDFIAWVDAFKTAMLDEKRMSADNVIDTYEREFHQSLSLSEKLMVRAWLAQTRKAIHESEPKVDTPYGGADLRNAAYMPNGPSRTQPFRNLVRNIMDRPAMLDRGLCKFPVLYEQQDRDWGQFDGTVRNRITRSVLAAMAIGATVDNLAMSEITGNVEHAIDYTLDLKGPKYTEIFPQQKLDAQKIGRGEKVYFTYCESCHGHPNPQGSWVKGKAQGIVFPYEVLGTDSERVTFRYYDVLADYLYTYLPEKQPLRPKREDLRPGPLGRTRGYISSPLQSAFTHAPYLHNGSVLTMAELINLKPRRNLFYRGDNTYDPVDLGLVAPDQPDVKRYFRFDVSDRGNSNRGHNYPWAYKGVGWDEGKLKDLLEYLKTL